MVKFFKSIPHITSKLIAKAKCFFCCWEIQCNTKKSIIHWCGQIYYIPSNFSWWCNWSQKSVEFSEGRAVKEAVSVFSGDECTFAGQTVNASKGLTHWTAAAADDNLIQLRKASDWVLKIPIQLQTALIGLYNKKKKALPALTWSGPFVHLWCWTYKSPVLKDLTVLFPIFYFIYVGHWNVFCCIYEVILQFSIQLQKHLLKVLDSVLIFRAVHSETSVTFNTV